MDGLSAAFGGRRIAGLLWSCWVFGAMCGGSWQIQACDIHFAGASAASYSKQSFYSPYWLYVWSAPAYPINTELTS